MGAAVPSLLYLDTMPDKGRGVLLSGDILQVVPSGHVSFMWSYPNLIPLSAAKVQRMAEILEPFAFDAVYGAFSGRGQIDANGKQVVAASVARYIAYIDLNYQVTADRLGLF